MSNIKFRDPIHDFIYVRPLERKIIDTPPFQRLRNIKQLAFTYLVYHGAEHTRFGHSLGVMHLVSKAFHSAIENAKSNALTEKKAKEVFTPEKVDWYEQILRLIALTHDLGHAPFSHASESVFDDKLTHEDYTEKIIQETEISNIINEIGNEYAKKYGEEFRITPKLICDIYRGKNPGSNNEFTFLKSFMDSELDCDKMDYLLRDSLFCGVNYGKFDLERLISCLTIYFPDDAPDTPRLAIKHGGIQSFEEFVLARYFMFVQVYFHRVRRFMDIKYAEALSSVLPKGKFPKKTSEYLLWDDNRVLLEIRKKAKVNANCNIITNRIIYKSIYKTKTHPEDSTNFMLFNVIKNQLSTAIGKENLVEDKAAEKMPHKIPMITSLDDEKAIAIIDANNSRSTISDESIIIKSLTHKINIQRLYVSPEKEKEAREKVIEILKTKQN